MTVPVLWSLLVVSGIVSVAVGLDMATVPQTLRQLRQAWRRRQ